MRNPQSKSQQLNDWDSHGAAVVREKETGKTESTTPSKTISMKVWGAKCEEHAKPPVLLHERTDAGSHLPQPHSHPHPPHSHPLLCVKSSLLLLLVTTLQHQWRFLSILSVDLLAFLPVQLTLYIDDPLSYKHINTPPLLCSTMERGLARELM